MALFVPQRVKDGPFNESDGELKHLKLSFNEILNVFVSAVSSILRREWNFINVFLKPITPLPSVSLG